MDAHDSDVCVNVVGKSLEAVRLLSNLGSRNAPDSAYVLAAYDQLTTAAYLLHQIIPWTKEGKTIVVCRKEAKKMTTAIDFDTNEPITVQPVAIYAGSAYDTLLIADGTTGKPLAYGDINHEWYTDLAYDGDFEQAAEKIEGVYGADEAEWEAAANKKLAKYGLKLGDFDEKAGDRYTLVEA